jgi:Radical SAM superfamily
MQKKVLFLISMVEEDFYNLRNIKEDIKQEYPEYYPQIESLAINERPAELDSVAISPLRVGNVSGHWLAANISTPSKVVDRPMTLDVLREELEADDYTHVCVTAFLDGFHEFEKCMRYLADNHPDVIRLLGNAGAQYEQFRRFFDEENVCYGDGVPFLRELLGEPLDREYRIPSTVGHIRILGSGDWVLPAGVLTTSIGCPHRCDFCLTSAMFKGTFNRYDFTARDIYDAVKAMEKEIGSDEFFVFVAESNALIDKQLWYEVFDLFRGEEGRYGLIAPVSLDVLDGYDLDRLQGSAMRIDIANIGLESINSREYVKLSNRKVKEALAKFERYGIAVWGTFLIGYPAQSARDIREEVDGLIELNPTIPALLNLRPLKGTEIYDELKSDGKIKSDYLDVGYRFGFMTYEHDSIGKEFTHLPQMMLELYDYIESRTGHPFLRLLEVQAYQKDTGNIRSHDQLEFLLNAYSAIHPRWVEYFCGDERSRNDFDSRFEAVKNRMESIISEKRTGNSVTG